MNFSQGVSLSLRHRDYWYPMHPLSAYWRHHPVLIYNKNKWNYEAITIWWGLRIFLNNGSTSKNIWSSNWSRNPTSCRHTTFYRVSAVEFTKVFTRKESNMITIAYWTTYEKENRIWQKNTPRSSYFFKICQSWKRRDFFPASFMTASGASGTPRGERDH